MKKKRTISLSLFYLKYFIWLSLGIFAVLFGAVILFEAGIVTGLVYPANYAEKQAGEAKTRLAEAEEISGELIPELCQYAVFDAEGEVLSGNLEKDGIKNAWNAVQGSRSGVRGYYYTVVERGAEYCVLRYVIAPQYRSPVLRENLPPPLDFLFAGVLCLILLIIILTAVFFGRTLREKLQSLIAAAEKIQKQELDFPVMPSDIKEIAEVLYAVDEMRAELKTSLESQWKLEQVKKEQIQALAHDLKTPLTLVRGNAELLYDTELTEEQRECVDYIEKSSLQMQNYVQTLIAMTKDAYRLNLQRIDAASFLQEVTEQAKGLCAAKDIQLQTAFESGMDFITVDHDLFLRALLNVISNAVEYTPAGGAVFFRAGREDGCTLFSVSDTGSGFSAEALKHAAEQFYMEDQSRHSRLHFGIGLYMADLVMKQHNGELILANSEETGGAWVGMKVPG